MTVRYHGLNDGQTKEYRDVNETYQVMQSFIGQTINVITNLK